MGLEPTTTGITILKSNGLHLLSSVDTIYINQQVRIKDCYFKQYPLLI